MKYAVFSAILLACLASCRSKRDAQKDIDYSAESSSISSSDRLALVVDSVFNRLDCSFDTLEICLDKQTADSSRSVRIRAVRGNVVWQRRQEVLATEHRQRIDTVAFKNSASVNSVEHTASSRIYDPPNGTAVVCCALLIIVAFICIAIRNKV